jgi:SPP1 gp7 family putative phage head morphogenesis protein
MKRGQLLDNRVNRSVKAYEKGLAKTHKEHTSEMQTRVESFLFKYSTDNKLNLQEAEKPLNDSELADYKVTLSKYRTMLEENGKESFLDELKRMLSVRTITRLQALINELSMMLIKLFIKVLKGIKNILAKVFKTSYYRTAYNVAVGTGEATPIAKADNKIIETVLDYKWSGKHYSDRIWTNKEKMLSALQEQLTVGLVQGKDIRKMSREFRDQLDTSLFNAKRLIQTESAFVQTEATMKGYESMSVDEYVIDATLDKRTSKVCRHMDLKVFKVSERVYGINCPPFHPMCRSVIIPNISSAGTTRRARGNDGKTYKIPKDTSYKQWEEKFVS